MATAEELWAGRSASAKAFADSLLPKNKAPKKPKKTESVDLGSLDSGGSSSDENKPWWETPVVQNVVNAISIGTYTEAAVANSIAQSARAAKDSFVKDGNVGNAIGAYVNQGVDEMVNHNPAVMGIKAALGDKESVRTNADVIRNIQSIAGGEDYADSAGARIVQGVGGFGADVLLDPLNAIPVGPIADIAKGAARGATIGAKAAKDVAKGGEALDRTVGLIPGLKQGAKDGYAEYKAAKADKAEFKQTLRDVNQAAKAGVPSEVIRENVRGFDFLKENLDAGKKVSAKDLKLAQNKADHVDALNEAETATEVQKLADSEELTAVQTPDEIAKAAVRADHDYYSGAISVHKHNAIIRTLKGTAKMFGHDFDKAVADYLEANGLRTPKAAEPTGTPKVADSTPVGNPAVADSNVALPETSATVGKEITPEQAKAQQVKQTLANPESITPAFQYVDPIRKVDPATFLNDSPVDQFVKGTSHLTAEVPRFTKKTQTQLSDFLKNHPGAQRTVVSPEVLNAREIQRFLDSNKLRFSTKNPESLIHELRVRNPDGTARGGVTAMSREEVSNLIDKTITRNASAIRKLHAAGDSEGALALQNKVVTDVLKNKIFIDDLQKLVKSVKGGQVSPEVVEFAWSGAKPSPRELKLAGFKGDTREAMKTIREFGANLNTLSRKSAAFKDILNAYRDGKLPVEDMARFEEFASTFFKLTGADRLNKEKILQFASDFVQQNSDAIVQSGLLHAPMAESGRLTQLLGGNSSPGIGLLRILPPESATTYARPFTESERLAIVTEMAMKAEADILNGISPDFVSKAADDILDKHFTEYATPSGDFRTRDGWRTSTMNLNDGLPKKEFFWTTHSSIDLFRKINGSVTTYMKNIPELQDIRALAYRKGASKVDKDNYAKAYRNVRDNLSMRISAQVDANLKAHNVFGYLTNVMPAKGTAIRLSYHDVLNAVGPEIRMKHIWVPEGDINNLMPTQMMDVAETLLRTAEGVSTAGEIDAKQMLKNAQDVIKGNFTKSMAAKETARYIETNLDEVTQGFNAKIISKNADMKNANTVRNRKYTEFINAVVNRVGDDGFTPLQRMADTALRNAALHAQSYSSKIVYATEQQMKRLADALESGTVGNFHATVASMVRPDKFEPEVSKVFADEIRATNLEHTSMDELAVAQESANVAKISSGKEMVLYTSKEMEPWIQKTPTELIGPDSYSIPVGPKTKQPFHTLKLSTKNAHEVMLGGRRMLTDGKPEATKWSKKPWVSREGERLQNEINKANAKVAARAENKALHPDAIVETLSKASDEEIVNMFRQELAHDVSRRMFVGQRLFNVRFGKELSYDTVTSGAHLGTALETAFHSAINEYARKYPLEKARQAMRDIQSMTADVHALVAKGQIQGLSPETVDMAKLTGAIFDSSSNNWYVRNGVGPKLMNSILDDMGHAHSSWRFPTMVDGELVTPAQMAEVWKTWTNIENPYKAFSALHTAMIKASSDISMGARFSNRFGSEVIPKGEEGKWAKLNLDRNKNTFIDLIDPDLYYPKEIIAELPEWGRFITASRTFKNEKFQQWVNSFDEFTSALKLTQTVMKPGHHVMSAIGDFFRNRLAGVTGMKDMKDSFRVIASRNQIDAGFSELEKYVRLKGNSLDYNVTTTTGNGIHLVIGGKRATLSETQLYDLFVQKGIFLPAHNAGVAEDLLSVAQAGKYDNLPGGAFANRVSKIAAGTNNAVSGLVNNKLIKLNSFTAQRDNLFRGELAINAMKSKNFKSVQDALDFAEAKVRKWAPTAKDLTAAESKVNRRIFLYYTWLRGMIPRVVEGIIARPNVASVPSKLMYNVAIANGLDPASIGDPFDPNVLMPEYYTKGVLGPQWMDPNSGHLWGLNPTGPMIDVFNSVGSGVNANPLDSSNYEKIGRTLLGMTNPFFRSPVELTMMQNIGTGTPIQDAGQYLTDMPGPSRLVSKITGHTINPTLGGIPRRTEAKFKNGIAPDDWWNNAGLELTNFMTGLQVKDYTSDSAKKSAEFDQKQKLKDQKTNDARMGWAGQ